MATQPTSVALSALRESPTNPRKMFGDLGELTDSIRSVGILQPLVVREVDGGKFEIVVGHRRARAAKLAGLTKVPVLVRELSDSDALEIQLVENVQRVDIHPLEEAEAYGELRTKFGYDVDKLAERSGKSKASIYAALKLLDLCPDVRKAFLAGKVLPSVALLIARCKGERLQMAALAHVTRENRFGDPMSAREAAHALKGILDDEKGEPVRVTREAGAKLVRFVRSKTRDFALGRVVDTIERRRELEASDLRLVLTGLLDGVPESVLERRGLETPKQLAAVVAKAQSPQLRGLLVELALAHWVDDDETGTRLKTVCKAFDLDFRELSDSARELAEKEMNESKAEGLFRK